MRWRKGWEKSLKRDKGGGRGGEGERDRGREKRRRKGLEKKEGTSRRGGVREERYNGREGSKVREGK